MIAIKPGFFSYYFKKFDKEMIKAYFSKIRKEAMYDKLKFCNRDSIRLKCRSKSPSVFISNKGALFPID